jgi:hypothetical protein
VLNKWVEEANKQTLVGTAGAWDSARLNSLQGPPAGAWLNGVPCSSLGTKLTSEEFRSRICRRLGAEINDQFACPLCYQTMDKFGSHAEECMCGGDAVNRHNDINHTIYKQAIKAGTRPELEKSKVLGGAINERDLGRRRPADTLLQNGVGVSTGKTRGFTRVALDVGFVNPQGQSHMRDASGSVLGAAKQYTQQKRDRNSTDRLCAEAGIEYQPVVFETFGGVAQEARDTLRSLNRVVAANTNTPISEVANGFWQRVSVDIQKANHRAWAKRVGAMQGVMKEESRSARYLRTHLDRIEEDEA